MLNVKFSTFFFSPSYTTDTHRTKSAKKKVIVENFFHFFLKTNIRAYLNWAIIFCYKTTYHYYSYLRLSMEQDVIQKDISDKWDHLKKKIQRKSRNKKLMNEKFNKKVCFLFFFFFLLHWRKVHLLKKQQQ